MLSRGSVNELIQFLGALDWSLDGETVWVLMYIFNVLASNMPPPNGNEWYRWVYNSVQAFAANWENVRERGKKNAH